MQALQGLQLRGYARGERPNRDVANVSQEMFDANFFSLLSLDYRWDVDECSGRCCTVLFDSWRLVSNRCALTGARRRETHVFDLIDSKVGVGRDAHLLRLDVDNDK